MDVSKHLSRVEVNIVEKCVRVMRCLSCQFLCLFCALSNGYEGFGMFRRCILVYNPYKRCNKHRRQKMLRWGLGCTNSRIFLEGRKVVLILSLFKLFVMLWEELFGKVVYLWGGTSFIRYWVDISLRLILVVDFEGFRFSIMYKGFGVL